MRSVYFRLIAWYSLLTVGICLLFGAYMYQGLQHYLVQSKEGAFHRKAQQVGNAVLEKKNPAVAHEIERIFTPEIHNRFIRVTALDGTVIFRSSAPKDKGFVPEDIPLWQEVVTEPTHYQLKTTTKETLIVSVLPFQNKDGERFIIEVGGTVEAIHAALRGLLIMLLAGFPIILVLAAGGGYLLIRSALHPVKKICTAAENITLHNLNDRLPVIASGDSIEELSHTLNRMINRLDQSYRQMSKFSADASHELRTPLSIIRAGLETALMSPSLPEEDKERLGIILEEAEYLSKITESLFVISRLDAGEACIACMQVNLSSLASTTAEQILILTDEKNINFRCTLDATVFVNGDPTRLKQIIVNLLDNAIKYTPEGGSISLRVYSSSNQAKLEVEDSGVGIAAEDIPHIFKRFYRADKVRSRELGGGAGLGLSIIRSICAAHNGDIQVVSTEGRGTLFTVELPLVAETV